jgi:Fe-S-cluster-containing dehydrogenase component
MENSRRSFLKIAGISALGMGVKPVLDVFASSEPASKGPGETGAKTTVGNAAAPAKDAKQPYAMVGEKALTAKQWAMVIDTRKIKTAADLAPMIDVCDRIHNIPTLPDPHHEIKWIWEEHYENAFPEMENPFLAQRLEKLPFLVLCNHCTNPPCVRACPTQATFKNDQGIVMMDMHRCIGCRFCMAACPYGSRSFNFRDPRPFIKHLNPKYPTRMRGVVEKCDFCAERLAVGQIPACVEASNGAMAFGDLEDPTSQVRKLLSENYTIRRKQGLGTGPNVYYIV